MKAMLGKIAVVSVGMLGSSCSPSGDSWIIDRMSAAAANDQIMLVRNDPPSFGYQRLASQARLYPDMGFFISQRGLPDFLAETGSGERHYFILYYLKDRQAYACRTRSSRGNAVEFAGPYPITDREFSLLNGFRRERDGLPEKA